MKKIFGKAGDAVVFDSNLWHKGGESTENNRVSLFSLYGPWWIKPYFNYEKYLGKKNTKSLDKNIKNITSIILHLRILKKDLIPSLNLSLVKIKKVKIGTNYKPFIIGEVSGNHKRFT